MECSVKLLNGISAFLGVVFVKLMFGSGVNSVLCLQLVLYFRNVDPHRKVLAYVKCSVCFDGSS